ncbi:hypothetical protein BGZ94_008147 [Podila epigama]|nr:hypothetical protein BGZ94_008147 [Podila epigama]
MSQFYTPLNPSTFTTAETQKPVETLVSAAQPTPTTVTTPSIGANAALLVANLATMPGFLSETAIQEARQQYRVQPQLQTTEQPLYGVQSVDNSSSHSNLTRTSLQPSYQPLSVQSHYHDQQINNDYSPSYAQSKPMDATADASLSNLLDELKSTVSSKPYSYETATTQSTAGSLPSYSYDASPQPSLVEPDTAMTTQPVNEDYSNGKITPQLLKKLASLAEEDANNGGKLWAEINRLKELQIATEKRLYEERQALQSQHAKDLVKLQASEIMGVDVRDKIQQTKQEHRQELRRFDRNVVYEMDKVVQDTQVSLSQAHIPMFYTTTDPTMIASQIKVIRLLEDMFQG